MRFTNDHFSEIVVSTAFYSRSKKMDLLIWPVLTYLVPFCDLALCGRFPDRFKLGYRDVFQKGIVLTHYNGKAVVSNFYFRVSNTVGFANAVFGRFDRT